MYIHLGGETVVHMADILGVFDIEKTSAFHDTREFLRNRNRALTVVNVSYDMPKSFIVAQVDGKPIVYISPIAAATLRKRSGKLLT